MLQKGADKLKGLLVGRLCKEEDILPDDIRAVLLSREDMKDILPVGGTINIRKDKMIISEH
jgi:hypothetical protein